MGFYYNMESFGVNLNKVKQPKPDVSLPEGQKRVIQNPYVGIISDINPSPTPISDTLAIKGKEFPKDNTRPVSNTSNRISFDNIATGGIIACGILAVLSIFKKK